MKKSEFKSLLTFFLIINLSNHINSAPVIIQPGLPGEDSQLIDASMAIKIADTSHTLDDVMFMQQMIPHHKQLSH